MAVIASYTPIPTPHTISSSGAWLIAVYVLLQFAVIWGYYVLFEGLWDGQTPGKRMMQLRVVSDGGFSVSFGASAVRNIIRALDAMPIPLYVVGIVTALLNSSRKRLGDMVAGTIVIKESRTELRARAPSPQNTRRIALTTRLSDDEYALLDRYVTRRNAIDAARRDVIISQLGVRFASTARDHTTQRQPPRSSSCTTRNATRERAALPHEQTPARGASSTRSWRSDSSAGTTSRESWIEHALAA